MEYFGKNLSDLRKKEPLSCKYANTTISIDFFNKIYLSVIYTTNKTAYVTPDPIEVKAIIQKQ